MGNKKRQPAVQAISGVPVIPTEGKGTFEQGYDKLGRPYEKKRFTSGAETKREDFKDGSKKFTVKLPPT